MIHVAIYNEYIHERESECVAAVYPQGIHAVIADFLRSDEIEVKCFTLDTVNEITDEELKTTDVMIWWGHKRHDAVPDEVAARVRNAVQNGMGIIFLHSAHHSKPFKFLMGTCCHLTWREDGDMERVWTVRPAHPIAQGIGRCRMMRHTVSLSEFRNLMKWCLSAGTKAERYSAVAALSTEIMAKSSISSPVMRLFRYIMTRMFRLLSVMLSIGQNRLSVCPT